LLLTWLAAAAATILFYSRWGCWWGGWCYGPRFLCECMPVLCLFTALGLAALRRGWPRRAGLALIGLSVAIHLVGLFGQRGYVPWHERHDLVRQPLSLFALQDTQIEAHLRAVLGNLTVRP
jgi:hypothetical protein